MGRRRRVKEWPSREVAVHPATAAGQTSGRGGGREQSVPTWPLSLRRHDRFPCFESDIENEPVRIANLENMELHPSILIDPQNSPVGVGLELPWVSRLQYQTQEFRSTNSK